jgi:hypothetical protein
MKLEAKLEKFENSIFAITGNPITTNNHSLNFKNVDHKRRDQ